MQNSNTRFSTLFLVQFSALLALEAIVCFTFLGSLPIGPLVATLSHIPVIITAIMLGTGAGAAMGGFFGLFSLIVMTWITPTPLSFVFTPFYSAGPFTGNAWSLVICFVPRILIGVVAGLSANFLRKAFKNNKIVAYSVAAVLGSVTNTFLVLGGIYVFFGVPYAAACEIAFSMELPYNLLLSAMGGVVLTNGIPEAIVAAIVCAAVCIPLEKVVAKTQNG